MIKTIHIVGMAANQPPSVILETAIALKSL